VAIQNLSKSVRSCHWPFLRACHNIRGQYRENVRRDSTNGSAGGQASSAQARLVAAPAALFGLR